MATNPKPAQAGLLVSASTDEGGAEPAGSGVEGGGDEYKRHVSRHAARY